MSGFYFKDFERFANSFSKKIRSNKHEIVLEYIMRELGDWVVGEVKERTPVGKYPSWKHVAFTTDYGKVVSFIARDYRTGGTLRRGWKRTNIVKVGGSYQITIYNNVYYAPWVERGHNKVNRHGAVVGWQPGRFMLELTFDELQEKIVPLVGPLYEKLLREYMEW